ncbi:ribonuclease H-like domain-containing protein [Tanacetum coccineum]|uniref:Ribonuclease H-like domain-containing protein n=1 Tax=Tanacetum coccineum TaxID=301880 RepID=A0ABQ5BHX9_9ASTR
MWFCFGTMICAYDCYVNDMSFGKTCCVDSQALISVDTFINWQDHEDTHADEGALKIYGMIAGMESDPDFERKATSEYALMGFTKDKEVQTCSFECEYKYNELKKLYNEQREEISNSSVELNAYKSGVKTLEAQIRCHQKNQLAYEEKIRILKFDLEDKSNLLAYHEKLVANAAQEKQALQAKLDNELANTANWIQSSKNLIKLIDSSISVKDKLVFTKEGDMYGFHLPVDKELHANSVHVEIDEIMFHLDKNKQTSVKLILKMLKPVGEGYAFPKKACFACGSLSHLIKDFPTGRIFLSKPVTTGRRNLPTLVPTGKAVPAGRPNYPIPVTSGRTNNTVRPFPSVFKSNRPNTQSASPSKRPLHRASPPKTSFSNFGGDKVKTVVKTSTGYSWSSSRPKPEMVWVPHDWKQAQVGELSKFEGGNVTFGGGEGKITGKGTIRIAKLDFENVLFVKELQHFNLFSVSQICDKKNMVLFTKTECLVLTKDFKLPDETQVLLKVPRKHNLYSFNLEDLAPQGDLACLLAKASLDESTQWHRILGHVNFKNMNKLVKGNLVRELPPNFFRMTILVWRATKASNTRSPIRSSLLCGNGTEFKNRDLIELCGSKGIKRDYSNARTPQQNGVAERKNRTLIEAARTMLADSSLPTMFWTKAVATACYVLNRGKAYRVYNLASKRVEETMNVKFLENKPNVAQTGPAWYFDLDYLTDSMDYSRVRSTNPFAGSSNATTNNAGSQDTNDSDTDDDQDVIILPSYPSNATSSPSQMAPQDSSSVKSHSSLVVEGTQAEKEELASLERQEHEANAEAERLGLEFAQAEEDLVFSATKSFQTPSTNAVTPGSTLVTPGSTPVTPGTLLTPGTPITPDSAPSATSTSPDILSAGASSLRYPHPSAFANEFATGIPILKDIYDNPGSGMFTSSSYDDEELLGL